MGKVARSKYRPIQPVACYRIPSWQETPDVSRPLWACPPMNSICCSQRWRRHTRKRPRRRAIGAGRRFVLDLRNRVLLLLFYYRTYATQDVAAEVFGVGQATVSRSIEEAAPVVRQCVPAPARIHDRTKRASTLEELEEILPGLRCLIDASERQVQRPKRKDMEKSHYSSKAGRHTAKV